MAYVSFKINNNLIYNTDDQYKYLNNCKKSNIEILYNVLNN